MASRPEVVCDQIFKFKSLFQEKNEISASQFYFTYKNITKPSALSSTA